VTAIIYARISKDEKGKKAGVERQLRDCRAFAESRGTEILSEQFDNHVSASEFSEVARPGWDAVMTALRTGAADTVLTWDFDRCYRRPAELEELLAFVKTLGRSVYILSVNDGLIDLLTSSGRKQARDKASTASHESDHKSERQIAANLDRVRQGLPSTKPRQRPFGYGKKGIKIVDSEADAIRDAYQAVIAGASVASVARRWNDAGFTTSRGKRWTSGAASLVLASPRYWGRVPYKRDDAGKAVWEPIVTEETWRTARALLGVGRSGHHGFGRTLLGQLAYCGVCGDETRVHGGSNNGRRSYRCAGPKQHLSRRADSVENYVESVVKARLAQPDAIDLLAPKREDLTSVIAEADLVRGKLEALAIDYADDKITSSQRDVATERLRARLGELETKMIQSSEGFEFASILASKSLEDSWAALDIDARRRLVDALMTVTVMPGRQGIHTFDPDSVRIEWKTT
jgi:site-specific DNA recombinase